MDQNKDSKLAALRANQIAGKDGLLPISLAGWWSGVKSGRYPKSIKLSPRVTVWRREDILALLDGSIPATGGEK